MQLEDTASILAKAEFFEICDDEQRRLLAFASERLRFASGELIYRSGDVADGAHVLIKGMVTTQEEHRASKPYRTSQPGSVLGLPALILAKPRPVTITAIGAVETLLVPRSAFLKLARQYPELAQKAVERITADLNSYLGALQSIKPRS